MLAKVGMHTENMRLSTLWLFVENIGDWRIACMFRNFICNVRDACYLKDNSGHRSLGISLSPESNAWLYNHHIDLPAVQKKTDQDFFLERLRDFMRSNNLFLVDGSDAIVHVIDGLKRSVEPAFDRISSMPNQKDIENSLLGYLSSLPEWATSCLRYGRIYAMNPDLKAMLPRARVVFEVFEFEDGFWAMFPDVASQPSSIRLNGALSHSFKGKDDATLSLIDTILTNSFPDVFSSSASKARWSGASMQTRVFCAHGFRVPMHTPSDPNLCSSFGMLDYFEHCVPHAWFRAIGKYACTPHSKPVRFPAKEHDFREGPLPWDRLGMLRTPHWGWAKWVECMEMLRSLLFRPRGARQRWPLLFGPSTTGKTSMLSFLKHYYSSDVQCVARGGFATSDINASKRIIMLEEFRGSESIPRASDALRLLDVGTMQSEGKRLNSALCINNAVKCIDTNKAVEGWYKKIDVEPFQMRTNLFKCYLRVPRAVVDPGLTGQIEREWFAVVHYLGARKYLLPEGVYRRPTDKIPGTQLPFYAGNFASPHDYISFGVASAKNGVTTDPDGLAMAEQFFTPLPKKLP